MDDLDLKNNSSVQLNIYHFRVYTIGFGQNKVFFQEIRDNGECLHTGGDLPASCQWSISLFQELLGLAAAPALCSRRLWKCPCNPLSGQGEVWLLLLLLLVLFLVLVLIIVLFPVPVLVLILILVLFLLFFFFLLHLLFFSFSFSFSISVFSLNSCLNCLKYYRDQVVSISKTITLRTNAQCVFVYW